MVKAKAKKRRRASTSSHQPHRDHPDQEESDDPLAIIVIPPRPHVPIDDEVVPPSDEDEYEAWRAEKAGSGYWAGFKLISRATPAGPSETVAVIEEPSSHSHDPKPLAEPSQKTPVASKMSQYDNSSSRWSADIPDQHDGQPALDLIPGQFHVAQPDVTEGEPESETDDMELDVPITSRLPDLLEGRERRQSPAVSIAADEEVPEVLPTAVEDAMEGGAEERENHEILAVSAVVESGHGEGLLSAESKVGLGASFPNVTVEQVTRRGSSTPLTRNGSFKGVSTDADQEREEIRQISQAATADRPPTHHDEASGSVFDRQFDAFDANGSGDVDMGGNIDIGGEMDLATPPSVSPDVPTTPVPGPVRARSPSSAADVDRGQSAAPIPPDRSPSLTPPPPTPPAPNTELQDFISKRTIPRLRNRTAVQMHPYQMERAHYLTVIRQGRRPVEEEMSLAAEKRARNVAEDYDVEDETLEIASVTATATAVSAATPAETPLELEEGDTDEYFERFAESFVGQDIVAVKRMRVIVAERIVKEKEEKKRRKEIRKGRREFEALARQRAGRAEVSDEEVSVQKKKRRVVETLPEGTATTLAPHKTSKTYGRQYRGRAEIRAPSARPQRPSTARSVSPTLTLASPDALADTATFEGDDDFQMIDDPSLSARPPLRRERLLPTSSSSSSTSEEMSDGGGKVVAKKRIAGRMLPAAMLKRLEADQVRREAKAREKRARAGASASPARPGKAIIRKSKNRGAQDALDDAMGFLVDPDESLSEGEENGLSFYLAEQARERAKQTPIVVWSDEDDDLMESTSSEAQEDNAIHRQNRLLDEGDFESIVNGGHQPRARPRPRALQRRRPAIGLAGAPRPPRAAGPAAPKTPAAPRRRELHQSHLNFDRREPASKSKPSKSHQRSKPRAGARPRRPRQPAIYLDDETIYAYEEFAFDSIKPTVDSDPSDSQSVMSIRSSTPVSAKKARPSVRTASKGSTTSVTAADVSKKTGRGTRDAIHSKKERPRESKASDAFDVNVGKIRSWLYLGACDPSFGLEPLPRGTTMAPHSMLASGHILNVLRNLHGLHVDIKPPEAVTAFGFLLESKASAKTTVEVVEPVFNLLYNRLLELVNDRLPITSVHLNPVLKVLSFFRDYLLLNPAGYTSDGDHSLRLALQAAAARMIRDMAGIPTGRAKGDRTLPDFVLSTRWLLVEVLALTDPSPSETNVTALKDMAAALLEYGVNATMKSVKVAMALSPDHPLLNDVSIDIWVALRCLCQALDRPVDDSQLLPAVGQGTSFATVVDHAVAQTVAANPTGPEAAERVWYLTIGLCALSQLSPDGRVDSSAAAPMWHLVKRAIGLVTIVNDEQTESAALPAQVKNRDAYVRVMLERALSLVSTWGWEFADRESIATATRSLGMIFKSRNHRDLPSEPVADFPRYIVAFDMSLTAQLPPDEGTAYDLYLRLVCISASDLLSSATSMAAALRAEKDVQRLLQPIFPISPFPYTKEYPPSPRQLSALTNRYSTLIVACYFSPPLLQWLLANAQNWLDFANADFNSRRQTIRGVMYLAVACRHHELDLEQVISRLRDMLECLHGEHQYNRMYGDPSTKVRTRTSIERTLILVVTAFRQIILKPSYDVQRQKEQQYPHPLLLEAWAARILSSDLILDRVYGREIINTVQCFLDARNTMLPVEAKQARAVKASVGTDDEYPSLGFEFSQGDFAALGDSSVAAESPHYQADTQLARIIDTIISPAIYQILSTLLTTTGEHSPTRKPDLQAYLRQLTKCWVDCANVIVVEHRLQDWTTFVGAYGKQSWNRLRDDIGKRQVGMAFMLNVAQVDPGVFKSHEDVFVSLVLQSLIVEESGVTNEPEFISSVLNMPSAIDHPFLAGLVPPEEDQEVWTLDAATFSRIRVHILQTVFSNIPAVMRSSEHPQYKSLAYQSINILVTAMLHTYQSITSFNPIAKARYRDFSNSVVADIRRLTGDFIQASMIPDLKHFPLPLH